VRLRFVLAEALKGIRRNTAMVVSIILVTFVSLSFVGAGLLLQRQISKLQGDWYELAEVSVFMCPSASIAPTCAGGEATPEQITGISNLIETDLNAEVSQVYFESKDAAFTQFQARYPDGFHGTQLTADDMQASFRLHLSDPEKFDVVSDVLSGRTGVELVEDQRAIFQPLFLALNRASLLAGALALVMLITAALLIATTIRLSAMSRKRETGVMRLVGASNAFVQLPFVLEGAIAALIGSALAIGSLWLTVRFLISDWLQRSVDWVNYIGVSDVWQIAPLLGLIALVLAVASSVITLSRYTRV
jgi:cell division transport system permease protein